MNELHDGKYHPFVADADSQAETQDSELHAFDTVMSLKK